MQEGIHPGQCGGVRTVQRCVRREGVEKSRGCIANNIGVSSNGSVVRVRVRGQHITDGAVREREREEERC